jgi:tetratricopeptide (TPR) repeat protein
MATMRLFIVALGLLVIASPAFAQENVRVRGGGHAEFGRLVFDWPASVGYKAEIAGRNLIVRFDRPMSTNFDGAVAALDDYISGAALSGDNKTATIRLLGDFTLRTFENGSSIVVDVLGKPSAASTAAGSSTAPTLKVRKGQHPNYDRLVFDWTRPVEYNVSRDGARLSVDFNRSAKIDIAALRSGLGSGFTKPRAKTEATKVTFSVDVGAAARIRHFRAGNKVVLDVFRSTDDKSAQAGAKTAPAQPQVTAAPVVPVKRDDPVEKAEKGGSKSTGPVPLVPKDKKTDTAKEEKSTTALKAELEKAKAEQKPGKKGDKPAADQQVDAKAPTDKTVPEPKPDVVEKPEAAEEKEIASVTEEEPTKEFEGPAPDPVTLVFEWPQVVSMAAFRRNQYVWIVFGLRAPIQTAPLLQQSRTLIDRFDQIPSGQATVLRIQTKNDEINVSKVQLNGTNWLIEFSQSPMQPSAQISFGVSDTGTQGKQLLMPMDGLGELFTFQDPDVGDSIQVISVATPGLGMDGERAYPEFQILASAQGIAIESFNADLVLNKLEKAIVFGGPQGLYVSKVAKVPSKFGSSASSQTVTLGAIGSQILRPEKWQRREEKLIEVRQELMDGIIKQSPKRRAKGRTELARYNFSHGYAQEALGILSVVEATDLEAGSTPEFVALKGAVLVLAERGKSAQKSLNDPRLDAYQDVAIWRGAADYLAGDIETAAKNFNTGDPSLQTYPNPLKAKLLVKRLIVALETDQLELAKQWRDKVGEELDSFGPTYKARLSYLFGQLYRLELDLDNAVGAYQVAVDSKDKWSSVRAEYDLIDLNLQQETIEVAEAIQRLERLRFAWRGDAFERKVLNRLGDLYMAAGDYRNGLNTLKVIVSYFPKHPDAAETAKKMGDVFRRLYLEGDADNISPLKALALYDEFRELTPAGPEGNLMIQKLAERLVDVDLLDKAAAILGHQVKFRLRGEEKAAVGTKLALVRLIARDPQGALNALRDSFYPNVSLEVENDRRRIRAKAEFELGKANDAIALLAGDVSREADLLRSAIYFREANWGEAGKVYQRLVGNPPADGEAMDRELGRTVLLWAVALKLNRDEDGLRQLFDLYGSSMRSSPLAATFDYIAKPSEGSGFDLGSIQKQIADVDQFQAFMKNYRERLLKSGERPATSTGAQSSGQSTATPSG